ncbi:pirin-like [Palaemon carinicauda]|uniref:pirin-like n=1 Tax=Palaemon carinicauda TaxID=392227 RepID=UPI0035B5FA57
MASEVMRTVELKVLAVEQSEGQGSRVWRSIGSKELRRLDPFLLLDEFTSRPPHGFPDHPHRGFETVTYLTKGAMRHEDSKGHAGITRKGDLQWMTAGRGVVHSEMPVEGDASGLQLWVNLKASEKMVEPDYQELLASQIPTVNTKGVEVKVIAGSCMDVISPIRTRTPVYYLIFKMEPGSKFTQPLPMDWNAFIYILSGTIGVGDYDNLTESGPHHTLVLNNGSAVDIINPSAEKAHFVLVAGQPILEPVIQQGPFVMNTQEEILQAFQDYHQRQNGFEKYPISKPAAVGLCNLRRI